MRRSPKRRPTDLAFVTAAAHMKPAFILITNGNLNFEPCNYLRNDGGKRNHHRHDVELCFMHTGRFQHQPCQPKIMTPNCPALLTAFIKPVVNEAEPVNRKMVGAERFELSTSCTPSKRASQATLRPEPSNVHSTGTDAGFNHEDFHRRHCPTLIRGRMGGGIGIFGGRAPAGGGGTGGGICDGDAGLISELPIFAEASPIFISGNFISPISKSLNEPACRAPQNPSSPSVRRRATATFRSHSRPSPVCPFQYQSSNHAREFSGR